MPQRVCWLAARWALTGGGGGSLVCRYLLQVARVMGSKDEWRSAGGGQGKQVWFSIHSVAPCPLLPESVSGQGWARGFMVWAWGWEGSLC